MYIRIRRDDISPSVLSGFFFPGSDKSFRKLFRWRYDVRQPWGKSVIILITLMLDLPISYLRDELVGVEMYESDAYNLLRVLNNSASLLDEGDA